MQTTSNHYEPTQLEKEEWARRVGLLPVCLFISSAFFVLMLLVMGIGTCAELASRSRLSSDDIGPLIVCLALLAASLWGLMSTNCDYRWKTNSEGLHVKGIIRRRLFRWTDITQARIVWQHNWPAPCYVVRINLSKTVVPLHDLRLRASIQHHLHRHGKADALILAKEDECSILDNALGDVAWENQRHGDFGRARTFFVAIVIVWIGVIVGLLLTKHYPQAIIVGVVGFLNRLSPGVIWRVESTSDALTAVAAVGFRVGQLFLPWQSVDHAEWLGNRLQVHSNGKAVIAIPLHQEDSASARLLLSVLSHLHTDSQCTWIPIPTQLSEPTPPK